MSSLRGVVWACLWTAWAAYFSPCSARAIAPRDTKPAAVSVTPTQNWDGIDGQWNTMFLQIGEPAQYVRVIVSTTSQQVWAVDSAACTGKNWINQTNSCNASRGMVFNITSSSTWDDQGFYGLLIEQNLGIQGDAQVGHYGYDTVRLGDFGSPVVKNVTIGTIQSYQFWLGHLGLHPKASNFSSLSNNKPSFMTLLRDQGTIPGLSYGYTAGAQYRFNTVLSSLTLGGYDASRFVPNNISYTMAPDNDRDLVVWIQGMTFNDGKDSPTTLLSDPIDIFIDSTVAELWLPIPVCEQFEKAFGLTHDPFTDLYLVNNTLHDSLIAQGANVTFTIGPNQKGGPTSTIVMPYMAFDQVANFPYQGLSNKTRYFPIRRAQNDTQYTLGRTFLQEAYLVVDHDRANFSVSQVSWVQNAPSKIVTIKPTNASQSKKSGIATAAIAGIAVGAVLVIGGILAIFLWRRHVKKRKEKEAAQAKLAAEVLAAKDNMSEKSRESDTQIRPKSSEPPETPFVFPKAELPANEMPRHEMSTDSDAASDKGGDGEAQSPTSTAVGTLDTTGTGTLVSTEPVEAENNERPIYEMEGDIPITSEADSRMLSEKESMIVRERRYNGTDPDPIPSPNTPTDRSETAGPSPTSTISSEPRLRPPPRHRPPLTAADVAMVPRSGTQLSIISRPSMRGWDSGNTLPISPLSPRAPVSLEETILSPLSPLTSSEGSTGSRTLASTNPDRRRFSYELDDEDEATR